VKTGKEMGNDHTEMLINHSTKKMTHEPTE